MPSLIFSENNKIIECHLVQFEQFTRLRVLSVYLFYDTSLFSDYYVQLRYQQEWKQDFRRHKSTEVRNDKTSNINIAGNEEFTKHVRNTDLNLRHLMTDLTDFTFERVVISQQNYLR